MLRLWTMHLRVTYISSINDSHNNTSDANPNYFTFSVLYTLEKYFYDLVKI